MFRVVVLLADKWVHRSKPMGRALAHELVSHWWSRGITVEAEDKGKPERFYPPHSIVRFEFQPVAEGDKKAV